MLRSEDRSRIAALSFR